MSIGEKWKVETFLIGVAPADQVEKTGLTYRGVGLFHEYDDVWSLTHLNTGHRAFTVYGLLGEVLEPATEMAEVVDWTFKSLAGWKESDPDFLQKVRSVEEKWPGVFSISAGSPHDKSENVASSIAASRTA